MRTIGRLGISFGRCISRSIVVRSSYSSSSIVLQQNLHRRQIRWMCHCDHEKKGEGSSSSGGERLLRGVADVFGGMIVNRDSLPSSTDRFSEQLKRSLKHWKNEGKRGIWLTIPKEKVDMIPIAVSQGFDFHHAEKDHVVMTHWLPGQEEENTLPSNASTQVGVGAIVVDELNRVLLVQEGNGHLRGRNVWKIPTGIVEAGEDVADGAVREVLEETGVRATFEKMIAFRHMHGAAFGKSDMFFVCLLRASSDYDDETEVSSRSPREIAAVKWGRFTDFLEQSPYPRDMPLWRKIYDLCVGPTGIVGDVDGFKMSHEDARNPLRRNNDLRRKTTAAVYYV